MRALDRLISFVFSVIMLIISLVLILLGTGVIEPQMVQDILGEYVFNEQMLKSELFNPVTIAGIVIFLASLKTTIFLSLFKVSDRAPIVVKHKNGELQIAQDTIVNTAKTATLSYDNVRDVQARMVKKRSGIVIYEMLQVYVNSNIKELTEEIQESVKEVIKSTIGVNVLDVNIRIKNIYSGKKAEPEKTEEFHKPVIVPEIPDEPVQPIAEEIKIPDNIEAVEVVESENKTPEENKIED